MTAQPFARSKMWQTGRMIAAVLMLGLLLTGMNPVLAQTKTVVVENRSLAVRELYGLLRDQQRTQLSRQEQTTLIIRGCDITYDDKDAQFVFATGDYTDESEDGSQNAVQKPRYDFNLEFRNCRFNAGVNSSVLLSRMNFTGRISVHNSTGYGIFFEEMDFSNVVELYDVELRYLEFEMCHFMEAVVLNDNDINQLNIRDSDFIRNNRSGSFGFRFDNRNDLYTFSVTGTEFLDNSSETREIHDVDTLLHENNLLRFENFDADHLVLRNCVFDCSPLFSDFSVEKSAILQDNRYYHKVVFAQAPLIPAGGSVFPYRPIEGRIGTLTALTEGYNRFYRYDNDREYRTDFQRPWVEIDVEKRIIPVYSKLLEIYESSSDIQSYNACYNQMKRIEKTVSKVRYESNQRFIDWFRWKMDIFLEKFSAYGTDPVLSLYNSLLCILAFAILYAFVPSEEDNLRFHNIQKAVYRYVAHFAQQKKHFYSADELYEREMAAANRLKMRLLDNMESLPPVVSRIGMPFYHLSIQLAALKRRTRSVIRFTVFQDFSGRSRWERAKISLIISANFLGFLLWGLFMRCVNSFALSLNAFVTLGYGEIGAKGVARYFCVLEGMIGWFLLSIFSVSLISQILH